MIDRVATGVGRHVVEVPVGFKWFVDGLLCGSLGFGGEESAGASFLRRDGSVWTTDKDGPIMCLLAAEMLASTGKDPGDIYRGLTDRGGDPGPKGGSEQTLARAGGGQGTGRRPDRGDAHRGTREWGAHRWAQSRDEARVVRRAPVGNRGRVQVVRREFRRRGPPAPHP